MTVDRRAFLQVLGVSAVGAAGRLRGVAPTDPDLFQSISLGLQVRKPPAWHFVTASEVWIRRNQLEVVGGESARQELYDMSGAPVLATIRHPLPHFGAGLITWVQLAHDDDDDATALSEIAAAHDWTYRQYGGFVPDWEVLESAAVTAFAGHPASRCVVRFSDPADGAPIHMASHLLRHGRVWMTFNLAVASRDPTATDSVEFRTIEHGITLMSAQPTA